MYVFLSLLALVVGVALAVLGGRTAKIPRKPAFALPRSACCWPLTARFFWGCC